MAISGKTRVVGIFGNPIEHSFSPVMHNAAFRHLKLDFVYVPFKVEPSSLAQAVSAIKALNLGGVNVTIPHKERVLEYLDQLSPEARLIGAVNTIVHEGGRLVGYNTDGAGFLRSLLEAGVKAEGAEVTILGAGGAARAVAVQLALAGADRICILAPDLDKAEAIADIINENTDTQVRARPWGDKKAQVCPWGDHKHAAGGEDRVILINCTPVGMSPKDDAIPEVDWTKIPPGSTVCDLIYNPLETRFLKKARSLGFPTVTGDGMLLYQGIKAFELWTGVDAPVEVMAKALRETLGGK